MSSGNSLAGSLCGVNFVALKPRGTREDTSVYLIAKVNNPGHQPAASIELKDN